MQTRLAAYAEITQDYISYLIQQGHKETQQQEEKNLLPKEDESRNLFNEVNTAKPVPVSRWRNAFTGVFYCGKHARFVLWDMFAGHVKNNFILKRKAEHADFIALVDRIVKLDKTPMTILSKIKASASKKDETDLLGCLFDYFMSFQQDTPEAKKNNDYYSAMKALKRDIHDLARRWGSQKRIVKVVTPGLPYSYALEEDKKCGFLVTRELTGLEGSFSSIGQNALYIWIPTQPNNLVYINKTRRQYTEIILNSQEEKKLQKFQSKLNLNPKVASLLGEDQMEEIKLITGHTHDHEKVKNQNRKSKTPWKRFAKIAACFMGGTEIFIALAGLATFAIVMAPPLLIVFKILVGTSGLLYGYTFAKNELFALGKQISLGRVFKKKNSQTGEYESLENWQKALIIFPGIPLSLVAGICIASLAVSSVLSGTGLVLTLTASLLSIMSIGAVVTIFTLICCLAMATFFLTVKEVVSRITTKKLSEYWNSLKYQENEKGFQYAVRLAWEILKCGLALGTMTIVAWAGYFLFQGKCIDILGKVWTGLTMENTASVISGCYSSIKMVFGTEKILHLLQSVPTLLKQGYNTIKQACTNSACFLSQFLAHRPSQQLTPSSVQELNPIQEQARSAQSSYTATGLLLLIVRAMAGGGFYHKAAVDHHLLSPVGVATTSGSYIYAINAKPFLHNQEKQAIKPLQSRGMLKGG